MKYSILLFTVFTLITQSIIAIPPPPSGTAVNVYIAGDEISRGIKQFRIPALVRTDKGTLLAISEARTDPATDCAYKWLVARRSVDNGNTWSPSIDIGGHSLFNYASGNPMAVYIPATETVLVTYGARDLSKKDSGIYCSPGDGVFVVDDGGSDGLSWGTPVNISSQLGPIFKGIVPGPGAGIVLSTPNSPAPGRIVFSGSSGAYDHDIVYYSDNNGVTWNISTTPLLNMDESSVVELPDGRLMITLRNAHYNASCPCQAYSLSSDAGETWSPIAYDPNLPSPECEASVLLGPDNHVYFANPRNTDSRSDISVRRSQSFTPTGIVWEAAAVNVAPGLAWGGYSSMCQGDASNTWGGILFERNATVNGVDTDVISFVSFPYNF